MAQLWDRRLCFSGAPQVVEDCYNILKEYGFRFVRRGPIFVKEKENCSLSLWRAKTNLWQKQPWHLSHIKYQTRPEKTEDEKDFDIWFGYFGPFPVWLIFTMEKGQKGDSDLYLVLFYKHISLMTFSLFHVYSVKLLVIDQIFMSQNVWIFVDCGFSSSLSQCFIVWQNEKNDLMTKNTHLQPIKT